MRSWLRSTGSTTFITIFHVLAVGQAEKLVKNRSNIGVKTDNTHALRNANPCETFNMSAPDRSTWLQLGENPTTIEDQTAEIQVAEKSGLGKR